MTTCRRLKSVRFCDEIMWNGKSVNNAHAASAWWLRARVEWEEKPDMRAYCSTTAMITHIHRASPHILCSRLHSPIYTIKLLVYRGYKVWMASRRVSCMHAWKDRGLETARLAIAARTSSAYTYCFHWGVYAYIAYYRSAGSLSIRVYTQRKLLNQLYIRVNASLVVLAIESNARAVY